MHNNVFYKYFYCICLRNFKGLSDLGIFRPISGIILRYRDLKS